MIIYIMNLWTRHTEIQKTDHAILAEKVRKDRESRARKTGRLFPRG